MVNVDTISIILPILFLIIFQMVGILRSIPLYPNERTKMISVDYERWSYQNLFSRLPSPHDAFRDISPQQYMFLLLDSVVTLMYGVVRFELQGEATSLSISFILLAVMFYLFYPLIAIPEYGDLIRNNIEISSYTMYFYLTALFSLSLDLVIDGSYQITINIVNIIDILIIAIFWVFRHVHLYRGLRQEIITLNKTCDEKETKIMNEEQTTLDEIE